MYVIPFSCSQRWFAGKCTTHGEDYLHLRKTIIFSNSAYQKGYRICIYICVYIYTYIHDHYLATSILIFHAKSPRSFRRWYCKVPIFGHPITGTCQSCFISSAASWVVKTPRLYIYICMYILYLYIYMSQLGAIISAPRSGYFLNCVKSPGHIFWDNYSDWSTIYYSDLVTIILR